LILTRGDVKLRPWLAADAERVRGWSNDLAVAEGVGRALPVNDLAHREWFDAMLRNPKAVLFAIERQDVHVGNVWLWDLDAPNAKAEVRILIGATESHGRGTGSTAIDLLSDWAFRGLALTRLYAYVLASNPRARRAFEKGGFREEGVLVADRWVHGAYRDVWVLGKNAASRSGPR
jgi:RimJ/RimL family protein N-acetyltransferase